MDVKPLEDIGLTNAEIKVYLSLLEFGQTKVGPIIEKTGLQSSVVHNSLHKLIDKGLINYITKGKIKHYKATDPNHILNFIEEKKKNYAKILPELIAKQKIPKERKEAEIYTGYKGVMNMLLEIIKDSKPGDEYCFFSVDVEPINKEIQDFYRKYDPKRKAKGIIVKGIAPAKLKPFFADRVARKMMKMKFSDQPLPPNMGIFKDRVVLITWEDKPTGYLIYSKQLADRYKQFFNTMWESIK